MDFKGIRKALFILGLCVTLSDSKGNIWTQQNGNRWNPQNGGSDDVRSWSPEDSQVKDGENWNPPRNPQNGGDFGSDARRWNEGSWSSRDTQSKEANWSPNDSQSKVGGENDHSGFSPTDAQVKDYDKWNAERNQQYPGSFRPADSQSKDQWSPDSQTFGQEKIPSGWNDNGDQHRGPWQPEDTQVKDNWGQVKIDDASNQGPAWGQQDPGSNSVWSPPGGDSEGNRNWGTGLGNQGDHKPNQGTGDRDWSSGLGPSAGQGGDWPTNQNPGQEGTGSNKEIGGGDWSSGPGPNVGQGGDWSANQIPEQGDSGPHQGTSNGDWSPSVGQEGNWPTNPIQGQDTNGPNQSTEGGDWSLGSGPSDGQDISRPSISEGPTDQGPIQGGPSISEGPTVGQGPLGGQWDSNPQGGNKGDTGSEVFPPRVPQGNYKGGDTPHPGDEAGQWRLEDSIPGTPGVDYPNYSTVPATGFDCKQHENPGYYGDVEAKCQVFHICQSDGRHNSFLCPLGTIFNQQYFVCVWWFNYNCDETETHYALNADLYKGGHGHGQGNFKGDPYRRGDTPTDGKNDFANPATGPASSPPEQGFRFGRENQPNVVEPPEQPPNGQSQNRPGNLGGENGAMPQDAPGFGQDLETPQQGSGYGQDGPTIPEQGPGYGGQEVPQQGPGYGGQDVPQQGPGYSAGDEEFSQQGPGYSPGGQNVLQQGPGYGPENSELGSGYAPGVPQQGIGYGKRGPGIPDQGTGYEERGRPLQSNERDSGIQGGQGTDHGPSRGDWGQDGKRNWGAVQDKRGSTDGNWRGSGTSGSGVKGGWKSPDARGRKARSWGTQHPDNGLNKRWGSESENWISLEEAEPGSREAFRIEPAWEDNSHERRDVLHEDETRTDNSWESQRSNDDGGKVEEKENQPGVQWKSEEGENDIWSLSSSQNENADVPRLRKWRTVDDPRKEIEFGKMATDKGEGNDIWLSPESESVDIPKLRKWRTDEENPEEVETALQTSSKKNWWQEAPGAEGASRPKGRFARDTPHLFASWRTLGSQFGHSGKSLRHHHRRNRNR